MFDFLRDVGRAIAAVADAVADAVETAANAVGEFIGDLFDTVGTIATFALDEIGSVFEGIPVVGPIVRGFFHWLGTVVSAAVDSIGTVTKAAFTLIGDVLGGAVRIVVGALGGLLAWDADIAWRAVLRGLEDIGAGIAGAILMVLIKIVTFGQAALFMQFGERALTKDELACVRAVYRNSLAYFNVRVVEGFAGFWSINPDRAMVLGNRIYRKETSDSEWLSVLVHEACHVWQYQHFGSRYLIEALVAQAGEGYRWRPAVDSRKPWKDLNREAAAQFVQDVWQQGTSTRLPVEGRGMFFAGAPVSTDVRFVRDGISYTEYAVGATNYLRGLVSPRASQFLTVMPPRS